MSRFPTIVASVALVLSALAGSLMIEPRVVAAAPASVSTDVELRDSPVWDAPVLLVIPSGATITLDGPPTGEFYPVTFDGSSGWVPAAGIVIAKDGPPVPTQGMLPTMSPGLPSDPASQPTPVPSTVAAVVPNSLPVPTATLPPVEPTLGPVPTLTLPAVPPTVEPEPSEVPLAVSTPTAVATTVPSPIQVPTSSAEQPSVPDATPTPAAESTSTPYPSVTGPATATVVLPLRSGPSTTDGLLFSVPAGSTVYRTGRYVNGWVGANYMGIVGWIQADLLVEPLAQAAEPTPMPGPPRTPGQEGVGGFFGEDEDPAPAPIAGPGSGTAYASGEVVLRSGPSATYAPMATIPSGTSVVLTGVMENGFVRIDHGGQVGWVAFDLLSHPADPTPATSPRGTESRNVYSREEIVRAIYAAADRYGQPRADMLRVAECESNLDPYAVNASGSYGLFQFISSTWDSTPYANRDIFDPRANANAAGWMWAEGRRSEWVCQ